MTTRRRVLAIIASTAAALAAGLLTAQYSAATGSVRAVAGAVPAASSWGKAINVPGLATLGGSSLVSSVSCGTAGDCAAVGYYRGRRHRQGFVVSERHGHWRRAIEMPVVGGLYPGGGAEVSDVSCSSAVYCAAVGTYKDRGGLLQMFAVDERNGRWGKAVEVPGLSGRKQFDAGVSSVSCADTGDCVAGGFYTDQAGHQQGFVASERKGVWGKATGVPGLAALNKGFAAVQSVSCSAAASCAVGGYYADQAGSGQGFVASERDGVWRKAIEVPGLGAMNGGGEAEVNSMSCSAAGDCAAVGDYIDRGQNGQGFVASERNGVWHQAMRVHGVYPNAETDSVSCTSAGDCAAVGISGNPYGAGFAMSQKNWVWGKAIELGPVGRIAGADSVSCASAGNCAAGGFYSNASGSTSQGWVAVERHGRWNNGIEVPGLGAMNRGDDAGVLSVSCPPTGSCVASGYYTGRHGHSHGFLVRQTG